MKYSFNVRKVANKEWQQGINHYKAPYLRRRSLLILKAVNFKALISIFLKTYFKL